MKQVLFLFISLFVISCSKNPVPKPDNLLDEEVMVDIIYDISILQATDGSMPQKLIENDIKMDQYIFEKYKIDSITYSQNQRYYASFLFLHLLIHLLHETRLQLFLSLLQKV